MMQTYVKIDETFLYVFLQVTGNILKLKGSQGVGKGFKREIVLNQIDNLFILQLYGGKQISFSYEGEHYLFYDSGLGVTNYLETNLFAK